MTLSQRTIIHGSFIREPGIKVDYDRITKRIRHRAIYNSTIIKTSIVCRASSRRRNRNNACRNIKHGASINSVTAENEQRTTTTKLLLTSNTMNKQSRRDAVTTEKWYLVHVYGSLGLDSITAESLSAFAIVLHNSTVTTIKTSIVCKVNMSWRVDIRSI